MFKLLTYNPLIRREFYFIGIGSIAALVHLCVVLFCVSTLTIHPLVANIFAFLLAFSVSFLGHKHLTFSALADQKKLSLPHFFIVASSAGILNETLYFLILKYTQMNYLFGLILVLGLVAVYSFIISRYWACR